MFAIIGGVLLWALVLWTGISALLLRLSGWKRLAERYPLPHPPPPWTWCGQTLRVGAVRYRRCVSLARTPGGIWISDLKLFRHPALCLPWPELHSPASCTVYGRPFVRLTVGRPAAATIDLPADLYRVLFAR